MKKYMICTGLSPTLTVSEESALNLLDPEGDVRILLGGHSAVVISSLKAPEWNLILQKHPELLEITDDRGRHVFTVNFDNSGGDGVSAEQVTFGNVITMDGYATITVLLAPDLESDSNPLQVLLDVLSEGLNRLAEVEQMALAVLRQKGGPERKIRHRLLRL